MRRGLLLLAWSGLFLLIALSFEVLPAAGEEQISIASRNGVHQFSVEMALTEAEKARGLMYRRDLAEGHGMLFDFFRERNLQFWMKDTYVPLDMVFIRADGRIRRIAANAKPLSTNLISSGGPARAVLEVPGGTARRLGIAVGDRVMHPMFRR